MIEKSTLPRRGRHDDLREEPQLRDGRRGDPVPLCGGGGGTHGDGGEEEATVGRTDALHGVSLQIIDLNNRLIRIITGQLTELPVLQSSNQIIS